MSQFHKTLESAKYLTGSIHDQKYMARKQARENISQAATNMIIIGLAALAGYYAIITMPAWLPSAESTFHQVTNYNYVR